MCYLTKDTSWKYLMKSARGEEGVTFYNQIMYLIFAFIYV